MFPRFPSQRFSASLLRLSLQMFEKSPRVEMYRQVAQEVKSIFHIPAGLCGSCVCALCSGVLFGAVSM